MRSYICETDGSLWKIRTPRNGTFLNGHRVIGQEELVPGASLRLSNEEFEITFL